MALLVRAHGDVGGEIISAGGTGTYDLHAGNGVTEVQAGSYALMDTAYAKLALPFEQALFVVGTVVSVRPDHAVADVGLKALGMDHGNPSIEGARVWFCSDEHVTFAPGPSRPAVGDRVRVVPAHVDPTMAMHEVAWLVDGDHVLERWPVDLRGWG
jgi:D-serine deaminase-like pyridoxal phosphate-dependent protein